MPKTFFYAIRMIFLTPSVVRAQMILRNIFGRGNARITVNGRGEGGVVVKDTSIFTLEELMLVISPRPVCPLSKPT